MKKILLFAIITMLSFSLSAQWNPNGNNTTTGSIYAGGALTVGHGTDYSASLSKAVLSFGRNTASYVWSTSPGGYLLFGVNGEATSGANAALELKTNKEAYFSNKVSIGARDPLGNQLYVQGNAGVSGAITASRLQFLNGNAHVLIYEDSDIPDWALFRSNSGNGIAIIGQPDVVSIAVSRTNSNVGIGTKNIDSRYKLNVNGTIRSKEIIVETGWSDFVFSPTYTLISLEDLEQYIKTNNHLPDVPSEKEVKEKGLSLGQSDAVLLQKIEELTLYLIEQNKKTKDQSEKIKEQSEKTKVLEEENITQKDIINELVKRIEKLESNN